MSEYTFPELPKGQRWYIKKEAFGGRRLELQEYRKGWFLMRWRRVASEHLNPFLRVQHAIDYTAKMILDGRNSREEIAKMTERHRRLAKRLEEELQVGPVDE